MLYKTNIASNVPLLSGIEERRAFIGKYGA